MYTHNNKKPAKRKNSLKDFRRGARLTQRSVRVVLRASMETSVPSAVVVSSAGVDECNGIYLHDGNYGAAPLFKNGEWWMLKYRMPNGAHQWYIANKHLLDSDDGDLYAVHTESALPPCDKRWRLAKDGVAPPPRLAYVWTRSSPASSSATATATAAATAAAATSAVAPSLATCGSHSAEDATSTAVSASDVTPMSARQPSSRVKVFGSMRFDEAGVHKHEAAALKAELARHGIELFVAAPDAGADITATVFETMLECRAFIAFATATYAEDTGNPACTYKELQFWQNSMAKKHPHKLIPIRMLRDGEEFDVARRGVYAAEVLFGTNLAYEVWPLGSTRELEASGGVRHTHVDPKLVSKILKVVLDDSMVASLTEDLEAASIHDAPPHTVAPAEASSSGGGPPVDVSEPPLQAVHTPRVSPPPSTRSGSLKEAVAKICAALDLDASNLSMPMAIREANEMMGLEAEGPLPAQAARLLEALGLTNED
jgi:hypothetical protein